MQVTINSQTLSKAIVAALPATERQGRLPILAHVHLQANSLGNLNLNTTDLETFYHGETPAKVYEAGAITAPAATLDKVLKALPKDARITLSANGDGKLTILHGASRIKLDASPAAEYPPNQAWPAGPFITVPASALKTMLDRVLFSTSTDGLEYHLAAVLWENAAGRLRLVSTDGHRLSVADGPEINDFNFGETGVLVPRKGLAMLRTLLRKGETVKIAMSGKYLALATAAGEELFIRLTEIKYPQYRRIVPENCPLRLTLDRVALIAALKNVTQLSSARFKQVLFTVTGDTMNLTFTDPEIGEGRETLKINNRAGISPAKGKKTKTAALEMAFNARYLLEPLAAMTGAAVTLAGHEPDRPWALTSEADPGYLAVVMPANL